MKQHLRRKIRDASSLLVITALLAGCANQSPLSLINPVPSGPTDDLAGNDGPTKLDSAIAIAKTYRATLNDMSKQQDVSHNLALAGAFGLGVAAGVAALYGAARDLVLGLGLGAGGLAAADSVNYQRGFVDVYTAGQEAMSCLVKIGIGARGVAGSIDDARHQLDLSMEKLKTDLDNLSAEGSADLTKRDINDALAAYDQAEISKLVIDRVRKPDGPEAILAQSLREATDTVAREVAHQIRDREPNFAAIRNAVASVPAAAEAATAGYERTGASQSSANSESAGAVNVGSNPSAAPAEAKKSTVAREPTSKEPKNKAPAVKKPADEPDPRVGSLRHHSRDLWKSIYFIKIQQHEIRTVARRQLESCKLANVSASPAPLSIDTGSSSDSLTVAAGTQIDLTINGGTPLYNYHWLGPEPPLVRVRIVGNHAMINVDGKAPKSGPSILAIEDSSKSTETAKVSISVTPAE